MQDESVTPIQKDIPGKSAHSNVVTEAEDHMLDEADDNMSVMSSSEEK